MPLADVSNHGVDATSPRASKPAEQLRAAAGAVAAPGAQAVPGEAGGAAAEQPPPQESEGDLKKNNSLQELKEMCLARGLKVTGNKSELAWRLANPTAPGAKRGGSGLRGGRAGGGGGGRTQLSRVHKQLEEAGFADPEEASCCAKAAIKAGHLSLSEGLDAVIFTGECPECECDVPVTLREVLWQPDCGDDYEDGSEGGALKCKNENCCGALYVTGMCTGKLQTDCGKFHHHCRHPKCKGGFGMCIHDYRNAHCDGCNKHYFCGLSGFGCTNCSRGKKRGRGGVWGVVYDDDDSDDYAGDYFIF